MYTPTDITEIEFAGHDCSGEVCVMLKKITLVVLAVLALGVGFIAVRFLIPMYTVLDKVGPGSAPRDLALQNDNRVEARFGNAQPTLVEGQPSSENMAANETRLYWGELHLHTAERVSMPA